MSLADLVIASAQRVPERLAVKGPDAQLTYAELDAQANQVARVLASLGVKRGDRVGVWCEKSTRAVVAFQAISRLGAAYVPLDPLNPLNRVLTIVSNCGMSAVLTTPARVKELRSALPGIRCLSTGEAVDGEPGWDSVVESPADPVARLELGDDELAYILYTSGSTGTPKGVCLSQLNALAFIDWSVEMLKATSEDRFANHAPFFFDLSVLDLYAAFQVGASVHLVPEGLAFAPRRLVDFLQREEITVWYSVPSALILMMEHAELLEAELPRLRVVLFAGEPFPIKHLRPLWNRLRGQARFLNLYGPTETNVCTFYEVQEIPETQTEPVPIGIASCGDRVYLANVGPRSEEDPTPVGELMVEGPTVMLGYWGHPPQTGPYNTGDLVFQRDDGQLIYLGRRDNMVKVHGRRIELGEIEAAIFQHPAVRDGAVVVIGSGSEARLVAFLVTSEAEPPGLVELKRHCAQRLPRYMIVDDVHFIAELPRTRNGKIDRKALAAMVPRAA